MSRSSIYPFTKEYLLNYYTTENSILNRQITIRYFRYPPNRSQRNKYSLLTITQNMISYNDTILKVVWVAWAKRRYNI